MRTLDLTTCGELFSALRELPLAAPLVLTYGDETLALGEVERKGDALVVNLVAATKPAPAVEPEPEPKPKGKGKKSGEPPAASNGEPA